MKNIEKSDVLDDQTDIALQYNLKQRMRQSVESKVGSLCRYNNWQHQDIKVEIAEVDQRGSFQ